MKRRAILGVCMLLLSACHHRSGISIDLSCDQIIYDPAHDEWRLEARLSHGTDSVLAARNLAQLTVRGFNYADSALLDRTMYVSLRDTASGAQLGASSDSSRVDVKMPAGEYTLRATCPGCSPRADSVVRMAAGAVDTIDAYLTRFPDNCEADSIRSARALADSAGNRSVP